MFDRRDTPFLHWVDDQLIPADTAARAAAEFPPPGDHRWHTFTGRHEHGKSQCPEPFGPVTTALLAWLRSPSFGRCLEQLTGIGDLESDVVGGGMHQTGAGGRLDMHVDFNAHPTRTGLRRALNLLIYLNDGWTADDGGQLRLGAGADAIDLLPAAGRAVLFPTNDTSWHGHPTPVAAGRCRRSIAVYYFTPDDVARPHSTEWLDA